MSMGYAPRFSTPSTFVPPNFDRYQDRTVVAMFSSLVSVANGVSGSNSFVGNAPSVGFLLANETNKDGSSDNRDVRLTNTYTASIYNKLVAANDPLQWRDGSDDLLGGYVSGGNYEVNLKHDPKLGLSNYFVGTRLRYRQETKASGLHNLLALDVSIDSAAMDTATLHNLATTVSAYSVSTSTATSTPNSVNNLFDSAAVLGYFISDDYQDHDGLLTYAIFREFTISSTSTVLENIIAIFGGLHAGSRLGNAMTGQFTKLTELCSQSILTRSISMTMQQCFHLVTPYGLATNYDENFKIGDSQLDSSVSGFINHAIYSVAYFIDTRQFERFTDQQIVNIDFNYVTEYGGNDWNGLDTVSIFKEYYYQFNSCYQKQECILNGDPDWTQNYPNYPHLANTYANLIVSYLIRRLPVPKAYEGLSWENVNNDPYTYGPVIRAGADNIYSLLGATGESLMEVLNMLYYRNGVTDDVIALNAEDVAEFPQLINNLYTTLNDLATLATDIFDPNHAFNYMLYGDAMHADRFLYVRLRAETYGLQIEESTRLNLRDNFLQIGALLNRHSDLRYAYQVSDNFASGFGMAMIDGAYAPGWANVDDTNADIVASKQISNSGYATISNAFEHVRGIVGPTYGMKIKSKAQIGWATYRNSFPIVDICAGSGVGGAVANYAALMGHCRSVITFGAPKFSYTAFSPVRGLGVVTDYSVGPSTIRSVQGYGGGVDSPCHLDSPAKYALSTFTRRTLANTNMRVYFNPLMPFPDVAFDSVMGTPGSIINDMHYGSTT